MRLKHLLLTSFLAGGSLLSVSAERPQSVLFVDYDTYEVTVLPATTSGTYETTISVQDDKFLHGFLYASEDGGTENVRLLGLTNDRYINIWETPQTYPLTEYGYLPVTLTNRAGGEWKLTVDYDNTNLTVTPLSPVAKPGVRLFISDNWWGDSNWTSLTSDWFTTENASFKIEAVVLRAAERYIVQLDQALYVYSNRVTNCDPRLISEDYPLEPYNDYTSINNFEYPSEIQIKFVPNSDPSSNSVGTITFSSTTQEEEYIAAYAIDMNGNEIKLQQWGYSNSFGSQIPEDPQGNPEYYLKTVKYDGTSNIWGLHEKDSDQPLYNSGLRSISLVPKEFGGVPVRFSNWQSSSLDISIYASGKGASPRASFYGNNQPGEPLDCFYVIGACQGWDIGNGEMILERISEDSMMFTGRYYVAADKAMFRLYTKLGDWDDGSSWGLTVEDYPIPVEYEEGMVEFMQPGKGSIDLKGWEGGYMKFNVDATNYPYSILLQLIGEDSGVEGIVAENGALTINVEGNYAVASDASAVISAYGLDGRMLGTAARALDLSAYHGAVILKAHTASGTATLKAIR